MIRPAPGRAAAWRPGAAGGAVLALSLVLAASWLGPARAVIPDTPAQAILSHADTPAHLRERLDSLASALAASDPALAGEARYYLGSSYMRASQFDSAIVAFEAALKLRGDRQELLGLADASFLRGRPGDAEAALRRLQSALGETSGEPGPSQAMVRNRIAWAYFLAGRPDSAAIQFGGGDEELSGGLEWRYRKGVVRLKAGDAEGAFRLLWPVALASRMQDEEVMTQIQQAAAKTGHADQVAAAIANELHSRDAREQRLIESWGGRRVRFEASDHFSLVGFVVPASRRQTRPPGAVILMAPDDTLPLYDSLVVALRGHGVSTILVPPRGTSWSVGPSCPLPDAWVGREELLQHRAARDVPAALRALRAATPIDTARVLIAGVQSTVTIAAEAARAISTIRALLAVSPLVAGVDRGPLRATLAAAQVPAFYQIAPEDFGASYDVTDVLYQAGNRSASRVVEATTAGHGVAQFRADHALGKRFVEWLDGALKTPRAKATRPAAPPKG
jgi:tetratricopeptide (TPR) repeat protein